jgi:Lrp/AsnC family leucine-responsive transcriptional regulator
MCNGQIRAVARLGGIVIVGIFLETFNLIESCLEKFCRIANIPVMDKIDRKICDILQRDGKTSSAELADSVGVSLSTANERVRRMAANGEILGWHARVDPEVAGAGLCCFVLIDMAYEGEEAACAALVQRDAVMELHHISGAHSYMMKLRVRDTRDLQRFLSEVVKPIKAVLKTETIISMDALKESAAVRIADEG